MQLIVHVVPQLSDVLNGIDQLVVVLNLRAELQLRDLLFHYDLMVVFQLTDIPQQKEVAQKAGNDRKQFHHSQGGCDFHPEPHIKHGHTNQDLTSEKRNKSGRNSTANVCFLSPENGKKPEKKGIKNKTETFCEQHGVHVVKAFQGIDSDGKDHECAYNNIHKHLYRAIIDMKNQIIRKRFFAKWISDQSTPYD
ncbi:MAG: hypothetical protein HFG45_09820 [Oscillospiraceae bacterium]|nr:hypothetical protein [Oscillospiraceae bacterium]